jgi:hypothetical protein
MHQQLWGYKVEEKLNLGVREQKRLNTTGLEYSSSHATSRSCIQSFVAWHSIRQLALELYGYSVVGIATRYGLHGPGIESRWGRDFPQPLRPALGPTQPFPGVKRPGRGVDHPPSSSGRVKEIVQAIPLLPLWALMACSRENFTLLYGDHWKKSHGLTSFTSTTVCDVSLRRDSLSPPLPAVQFSSHFVSRNFSSDNHVLIYTTNRHFGLVDTNQVRLEGNTTGDRKGEVSAVISNIRWTSFRDLRTAPSKPDTYSIMIKLICWVSEVYLCGCDCLHQYTSTEFIYCLSFI